jgi:peptide/nickel transport system permease protein
VSEIAAHLAHATGAGIRWRRAGFALLASVLLAAVFGPVLVSTSPTAQDLLNTLAGPSVAHPLGTDHIGRDILARVVHGAPLSLGFALASVLLGGALGLALGLAAADRGGLADLLIMRLADLMLAFPGVLLALLLAGLLGGGMVPLFIALLLSLWPQFARMARAVALRVLSEAHVEASRLAGLPPTLILVRQVLPAVLQHTVVLAAFSVGSTILTISSLGFLGLGMQPPTPEWGAMITELLPYIHQAPLQLAAPCICIFVTVLTFLTAGEALARRMATGIDPV